MIGALLWVSRGRDDQERQLMERIEAERAELESVRRSVEDTQEFPIMVIVWKIFSTPDWNTCIEVRLTPQILYQLQQCDPNTWQALLAYVKDCQGLDDST